MEYFWKNGDEEIAFTANELDILRNPKMHRVFLRTFDIGFLVEKIRAKISKTDGTRGHYATRRMLLRELKNHARYPMIKVVHAGKEYLFNSKNVTEIFSFCQTIIADDQYSVRGNARGKVIVDAGANVGVFSIFAAKEGAARVHAFEPVEETHSLLMENIRLNKLDGVISANKLALGDEEGSGTISFGYEGDVAATVSLRDDFPNRQSIAIKRLDDLIDGPVHFIKIDTEGFEAEVLRGARTIISRYSPVICASAYHKKGDVVRLKELILRMDGGYSCSLLNRGELDLFCHKAD